MSSGANGNGTQYGAVCAGCVCVSQKERVSQRSNSGEEVDTRARALSLLSGCCEVLQEEHKTREKEEEEERKQRTWRSPSWQQRGGVSLARTTTVEKKQ